MPDHSIAKVVAHPLRVTLPKAQRTGQGDYAVIEIVMVEVETRDGVVGFGECLARKGAFGYAAFINEVFKPVLVGQDALDRRRLWQAMRATLSGRTGGMQIEAIAGVDIALWDIAGKAANLPVHKLLGGVGRKEVAAYASSINWLDDAICEAEIAAAVKSGFRQIKVKLGKPIPDAIRRAKLCRKLAPEHVSLSVDSNWTYDVDEAIVVGRALADLGYAWFEEPIRPEDREGYRKLASVLPIRLAAGESDFTASDALISLRDRSLGLIQPDVARSGGISETWRIAELAAAHNTAYAPHVGWSGALCVAASLQLAAAAESFMTFECMVYENALRQLLITEAVGDASLVRNGVVPVPQGPGLGVTVDRAVLNAHRIGA